MTSQLASGFRLDKKEIEKIISNTMDKECSSFSKKDKKKCLAALRGFLEEGKSFQEAVGVSNQELDNIYVYAKGLFEAGKYEDALKMFDLLLAMQPTHPALLKAMGVTLHRMRDYEGARAFYFMSFFLDEDDLMNLFYAYECSFKLGEFTFAGQTLDDLITRGEARPDCAKLVERARLLLKNLKKDS